MIFEDNIPGQFYPVDNLNGLRMTETNLTRMQCKKSLENVKCKPVGDGSIFTHNKDPNSRIVYATMLFNIEEKESYIAAVSLSGTG